MYNYNIIVTSNQVYTFKISQQNLLNFLEGNMLESLRTAFLQKVHLLYIELISYVVTGKLAKTNYVSINRKKVLSG